MAKIKPKNPTDDINAAFEKVEINKKRLETKRNFLTGFIDDIFIDNPEKLLKSDKRLEKKLNDFEFKIFSVSFEANNTDSGLMLNVLVNIDGKKITIKKQLK